MAGCGLDAHIVEHLNPALKNRFGKLAYWLAGFHSIMRWLPEFTVRVDGVEQRASFALISRVRNYGGDLEIARSIRLSDGDFEIVLFRGRVAARYALYLAGTLTNTLRHMPGASLLRGRVVEVDDSPQAPIFAQVDGEAAGSVPVRCVTVPDALTILLPEGYGRWTT
jgi:diacylglycerol kinase family enzyme